MADKIPQTDAAHTNLQARRRAQQLDELLEADCDGAAGVRTCGGHRRYRHEMATLSSRKSCRSQ